jgi:hypothetical protein
MATARSTIAADAASDMTFRRNAIADNESFDFTAAFDDFSVELVANGCGYLDRALRPVVPLEYVDVRAANGASFYLNKNIVVADRRLRHVLHPDATFCMCLDQGAH